MTPKILSLLVLGISLALSSCESDVATQSGARKLLLDPTYLDGELYKAYTFRAMVTNVPSDDIRFFWDFDNGNGFNEGNKINSFIYYLPGIYTIRVKAQHYFTDEILGIDSMRADIRPPAMKFELTRHSIDTTLLMNSDGSMAEVLQFTVNASTPDYLSRVTWDFGDGTIITDANGLSAIHKYTRTGTFTVRVSGKDASGVHLGKDSATVTIRMPLVNFTSITFARGISVFLVIDSTHPVMLAPLYQNPFAIKMDFKKDAVSNFSIAENKFTVSIDSTDDVGDSYRYHSIRDMITGELTADVQSLRSAVVTVNDTGQINRAGNGGCGRHYQFELQDLDLLAVTSTKIVYRSKTSVVNDFVKSIQFSAFKEPNKPAGTFDDLSSGSSNPLEAKLGPYALVVFHR